jgi:putative photosynthetic complex assembly protein
MLAALLLTIGGLRMVGWSPAIEPGRSLAERSLRFSDLPNGAVSVQDARTGETLDTLRGEQGFLRGVLRSLTRERRQQGVGAESPYTLHLHEDGRFLIEDPQTGARIDLASFGPDNAAVFLRWMPPSSLTGVNKP